MTKNKFNWRSVAMIACLIAFIVFSACDGKNDFLEYTITYNGGAYGTGEINAGLKEHGKDFILSTSTFKRTGYKQTGWSKTDGGSKNFNLGGIYKDNADITFYNRYGKWYVNDKY